MYCIASNISSVRLSFVSDTVSHYMVTQFKIKAITVVTLFIF